MCLGVTPINLPKNLWGNRHIWQRQLQNFIADKQCWDTLVWNYTIKELKLHQQLCQPPAQHFPFQPPLRPPKQEPNRSWSSRAGIQSKGKGHQEMVSTTLEKVCADTRETRDSVSLTDDDALSCMRTIKTCYFQWVLKFKKVLNHSTWVKIPFQLHTNGTSVGHWLGLF